MTDQALGRRAATSAVYVGSSQIVKLCLTMLSTIVVARLLSPSDYGVVAMVTPLVAFVMMFQDLGLSQAAVQAQSLSQAQSSSLFWLNVSASIALTTIFLALAPLVSVFYHDSRPGYVAAAWAINILVAGTALQHSALLNREMRFGSIAAIEIAQALTNFAVTACAALAFRSYWALWAGSFAGLLVNVILCWRTSGWRPNLKPSFGGTGDLLKFGGNVSGYNMLNFFVRSSDNILIAKVLGPFQLGLYDRSYKLMMLPLVNISAPLGRVMLPSLRKLRDDPIAYRRAYLIAVRALMLALIPGIAVSAATSDRLIPFLLGAKWAAASPIFFWLSLTGLVQPLPNATGWLFVTSGRVSAQLRWGVFSAIVTLIGFVVGVRYGAEGVAASLFFTAAARVPLLYWYATRGTSVSNLDLYRAMIEPFAAGGLAYLIIYSLHRVLSTGPLLLAGLLTGYLAAFALCLLTRDGRQLLSILRRLAHSAILGTLGRLVTRRRSANAPS